VLLEYADKVWHPRRIQDVEKIEKVQKKATKMIIGKKNVSYEFRLLRLKLPTLVYRRICGDMIDTYIFIMG